MPAQNGASKGSSTGGPSCWMGSPCKLAKMANELPRDEPRAFVGQHPAKAILHVLHAGALVDALGQVNHALAMLAGHGFLRVVFQILSD